MIEQLKTYYSGKKVFLTGHTGFKGSWLLQMLNLSGAIVKGYALSPAKEDLYYLIDGDSICRSIIADIRDREKVIKEIVEFQPDFVFHLAAQPLVRLSYEIPSETFAVNAIGTANILDGLRQLEKECHTILITTDKVYHNNEWHYPYRENDKLGGYDPYSASKACAELIIDSYRNSFFHSKEFDLHKKGIAVGRAGNVIGGGDWSKDRLIPDIARALGNDQVINIRNPTAVRPWQHVMEPLLGYLLLGIRLKQETIKFSQAYNFGPYPEDSLPVEQMVSNVIKKWGKGRFEVIGTSDQPHEAGLLKLDISKAVNEIGWRPRLNANSAIKLTTEWYNAYFKDKATIKEFTQRQIMEFINSSPNNVFDKMLP